MEEVSDSKVVCSSYPNSVIIVSRVVMKHTLEHDEGARRRAVQSAALLPRTDRQSTTAFRDLGQSPFETLRTTSYRRSPEGLVNDAWAVGALSEGQNRGFFLTQFVVPRGQFRESLVDTHTRANASSFERRPGSIVNGVIGKTRREKGLFGSSFVLSQARRNKTLEFVNDTKRYKVRGFPAAVQRIWARASEGASTKIRHSIAVAWIHEFGDGSETNTVEDKISLQQATGCFVQGQAKAP
ncbi:hypothetical protein C8R46DRAFT_1192136 [Mycena filopes]|nr:hypothetical protein C8R46DRAFT_1192136 [Mycena filopes]